MFHSHYPGGEDFDQRVMDYFIKLYKKKTGKDIRRSTRAVQKLRLEVEKAKRVLAAQHRAGIEIESLIDGQDFSETLTRAKFDELNRVCRLRGAATCLFTTDADYYEIYKAF